ncbi:Crp/Fnr family transcriptional regulator [Chryseobacterium sp. Chry.R1]|uniref:Crp/Fnr family transcriptional regulator n=1 Tax=Chryseobacterium sp. Chry.R1 TaxID=3139392 RepID=UPI0031F881AB
MIICENLLLQNGGEVIEYRANECIVEEATCAKYYLQIIKGTAKMNSVHFDGKEYFYGLPFNGHCIAESYLFTDKKYPFSAIAISDCKIIRVEKNQFIQLIENIPSLLVNLYTYTAERIHYKNLMLSTLGCVTSQERLTILLDYIKEFYTLNDTRPFIIPYTRQQLASLTGLTIESVIRTVKRMESRNLLSIVNGKIFY